MHHIIYLSSQTYDFTLAAHLEVEDTISKDTLKRLRNAIAAAWKNNEFTKNCKVVSKTGNSKVETIIEPLSFQLVRVTYIERNIMKTYNLHL